MGTQSRSGYAAEIMPEILTGDEAKGKALPIASEKGDQNGRRRLTPEELGQLPYKVVSTKEAQANMEARLKGELAPIAPVAKAAPAPVRKSAKPSKKAGKPSVIAATVDEEQTLRRSQPVNDDDNYDPLGGEYAPGSPELEAEEKALAEREARTAPQDAERRPLGAVNPVLTERVMSNPAPITVSQVPAENVLAERAADRAKRVGEVAPITVSNPGTRWMAQRGRVSLTLTDGTFSMPCVDVKECTYGITIFLPLSDDSGSFIPKPGAEISVRYKDRTWECYFPGTYFEVEELKLLGIVLVRKET